MKQGFDAIVQAHVARYLEDIEPARDALLAKMEARASTNHHPISDPEVASLLAILVRANAPKHIVEVGTNIGYGAIVLARAAGESAHVDTVEKSPELVKVARDFISEAGLSARITVHEDDAIHFLASEEVQKTSVDFAYIDCVKEDYGHYLDLLAPRISSGGMIACDNVLWRGLVALPDDANMPETEYARVLALRAFNKQLLAHPDFRSVILPLGDGVALATKH